MFKSGDQIGTYTLIRQLGKGAFGVVWLAEKRGQIETTEFALKFIMDQEPNIEAIKQEVKLWKHLSGHKNVTHLFEADIYDGQVYIVSEYIESGSLHDWLKQHNGKCESIEQAIDVTIDILDGLQHLHSKKVVHRDLKPQNILLQAGVTKLVDFGLSRVIKTTANPTKAAGTPYYMSPESFDGKLSEQSDIWAAGIILYQLISASLPFPETEMSALVKAILFNPPKPLPESVPNSIKQVVFTALEKEESKRYKTAQEMKLALQTAKNNPTTRATADLAPGKKIGGYKLVEKLGKGGFGTVWLAEREGKFATTQVALKVLNQGCDYESITKEAQVWARIGAHTNVVSIIEADIYDNVAVIVSEYVTDGSLKEWLERNGGRAKSLSSALSIIDGILAGLEHLHAKKIIHRDLKPANILIQAESPKLADFGLSRSLNSINSSNIGGTPVYMAPETFIGVRSESADLWAAGVIFYQMLAGYLPFSMRLSMKELVEDIRTKQVPRLPSDIPPPIEGFVYTALQKDPLKRFSSAADMRKALKVATQPTPNPQPLPKPVVKKAERGWAFIVGIIIALVFISSVGSVAVYYKYFALETTNIIEKGTEIKKFNFTTVRLNDRGEEIERLTKTANYFEEDLGNGVKLEMVEVPAGSFLMGTDDRDVEKIVAEYKRSGWSEEDARGLLGYETPEHQVKVESFYMGEFEVTQAQWKAVMGGDPSYFKGDRLPVENISWKQAKEFCKRLSEKTGKEYRLPSEAEWEYACRARTKTPFAFGEAITPEIVNYNGNYPYANAPKGKYRAKTVEVGSFGAANGFGLYDMHGNVWEWCEDVWHEGYKGAPADGSAWVTGGDETSRVVRGGSWSYYSYGCRSARRFQWDNTYVNIGFRVVVLSRTL